MIVLLMVAWPAKVTAQRALFPIPDPDPEIERKSFVVADGFEVNLFAADPLIAKPIQMNFDSAGRLWIASSEVYPQIKPGKSPTTRCWFSRIPTATAARTRPPYSRAGSHSDRHRARRRRRLCGQ